VIVCVSARERRARGGREERDKEKARDGCKVRGVRAYSQNGGGKGGEERRAAARGRGRGIVGRGGIPTHCSRHYANLEARMYVR
jgi:hypothetical protein